MYKIGDRVMLRNSCSVFEIGEIKYQYSYSYITVGNKYPECRYSIKEIINYYGGIVKFPIYSSYYYKESDLISLRELRKLKLERLNNV